MNRLLLLLLVVTTSSTSLAFSGSSSSPQQAQQHAVELPADFPWRTDVEHALAAVRRACAVTEQLQPNNEEASSGNDNDNDTEQQQPSSIRTVSKKDLSPVTLADFAVQALILDALHAAYPQDGFIAEEDSGALLLDETLCSQVVQAAGLGVSSDDDHRKKRTIHAIDLGKSYTQWETPDGSDATATTTATRQPRPRRVWCLDPIDGTRGFLRGKYPGGQYAIALALIEDGVPVVGILGCPNLPVNSDDDDKYAWPDDTSTETIGDPTKRGCVFVAAQQGGTFQLPAKRGAFAPRRLRVSHNRPVHQARFCIGVERFSDAGGQCAGMAQAIHGKENALDDDGDIVLATRMDSQAKHGVIARGGAELYARLPKPGYVEWIWDHAAGKVVVEEAGGKMTDVDGRELDFSLGAQLSPAVKGVLMSCGGKTHQALVDAYAAVRARTT